MDSGATVACGEAGNLSNIEDKYKCLLCPHILEEPMQLSCGHRCCRTCTELQIQQSQIVCPKCSKTTNKEKMHFDQGFINDMDDVSTRCKKCDWTGKLIDYEAHRLQAQQKPSCEFCGEQFDSVAQLNPHKSHCEQALGYCDHCLSIIPREQIKKHLAKSIVRRTQTMNDQDARVSSNVSNTVESPSQDARDDVDTLSDGPRVNDMIRSLKGIIDALSKESARLDRSVLEQNAHPNIQNAIERNDTNEVIYFIRHLECASNVLSDEIFTWIIQNFSVKMLDANEQRRTCISSPPFKSHENGYKMTARLYLRGDGSGRETHMSIFLVLENGSHDCTLRFPFDYTVTCCLYDQSGKQQHIIKSFRPDTQSNSFQQPGTNIGSGIPEFVQLSIIEQPTNPYIQNDTMYMKILVHIHTHSESNLISAYFLDIDPRLSLDAQNDKRKKILENFGERVCILCDICLKTRNNPHSMVCNHQPPTHLVVVSANRNSLT